MLTPSIASFRRFASIAFVATPLGIGAYGATGLAAAHPARLAADFAQPLVVATAWGAYGGSAFAWLAAAVAVSTALLIYTLLRIARAPGPIDRSAIFAGAIIGLALAALWPFVFSSDVYAYAAYGALAERGFDPATLAPANLREPFLDAARWQWQGPVPVAIYGPISLALGRAIVRFVGALGVGTTLAIFRLSACGAFLGSVALFDVALRDRTNRDRSLLLAGYALNPVVLWSVAEGHNDAFVALGLAAAAASARSGRVRSGGFVAGLLPLIKLTGVAFALGYAVEMWRTKERASRPALVSVAAALLVATVLGLPPLLRAFATVRTHGHYEPSLSAQGLLGLAPALVLGLAAFTWGGRRLSAGDSRGYAWFGIGALLALPNAYPWYALWLVPCALAAGGGPAAIALWGATISSIVRYLPDASGIPIGPAATVAAALAIAPLGIALAEFGPRAWHRTRSSP